MAIKLDKSTQQYLTQSIKRFFVDEMNEEIGDLKASLFLDFCIKEIGPIIYNQAIVDAQNFLQEKVADLSGMYYQAEFDFWKK